MKVRQLPGFFSEAVFFCFPCFLQWATGGRRALNKRSESTIDTDPHLGLRYQITNSN